MDRLSRRHLLRNSLLSLAAMSPLGYSLQTAVGNTFARKWVEQKTVGPFVCHAEFSLSPHQLLLEELLHLQSELKRTLDIPEPVGPIHLYLFASKNSYEAHLQLRFPGTGFRRALFVKQQADVGMVFAHLSPEFATDLRHECTHGLLHSVLPMVPLWLDEGLAEYFEVPYADRGLGNPYLKTVRRNVRFGLLPKLTRLEACEKMEDMGRSEYQYAWAYVHFMLHGPRAAHRELALFLRDIATRNPPGNLSERLEKHFPKLSTHVVQHFRNWK